jgi:hypothetical protein
MDVRARAGYSGCDRPVEIIRDGKSMRITNIISEWREPGSKHYVVGTGKNNTFKLAYDLQTGKWDCKKTAATLTE